MYRISLGWMITTLLLAPATVWGQARPKVQTVDDVRLGFEAVTDPSENSDSPIRVRFYKAGTWIPVYVSFTAGPDGIGEGAVSVESTDTDDVQSIYTAPMPRSGLQPGEMHTALTYTKLGSVSGEAVIRIKADDHTVEQRKDFTSYVGPNEVLYLTVGSRLLGLRQAVNPPAQSDAKNTNVELNNTHCACIDRDVRELPLRWFGYESVDLLILTTGNRDFVTDLLNERDGRKEAIAEWVRRGGRLVISCGRNEDMIPELLNRMQMRLPIQIAEPMHVTNLEAVQNWAGQGTPPLVYPQKSNQPGTTRPPIEIAKFVAKEPGQVEPIIPARESENSPLLMARVPYGRGQVVLSAFDFDTEAFRSWGGQPPFWKRLQDKTRTRPVSLNQATINSYRFGGGGETNNDVASRLVSELENFPDVSVISFGWVALFILIYIIIVGPVDYLFLKHVVKRLEYTWITFPLTVGLVCVGSYFGAYYLKGNDLKINKIDLVDLDPQTKKIYGTTWFSLFSPRIQLYTIGIQPGLGADEKTAASADTSSTSSTVLSWFGRPDVSFGGYGRSRSQNLFRRAYDYEPGATGLVGVPIQVWSTKSFTANWEKPLLQPLVGSALRRVAATGSVEGTVTNHLPGKLEEAVLITNEGETGLVVKAYALGTMEPGTAVQVKSNGPATTITEWVPLKPADQRTDTQAPSTFFPSNSTSALMRRIMFHDLSSQDEAFNSAFRYLDQSWRRHTKREAMLIGRLPVQHGPAETVVSAQSTASELWLGALPEPGKQRPALAGTMSQKTYVRVFLPVQPAEKPGS